MNASPDHILDTHVTILRSDGVDSFDTTTEAAWLLCLADQLDRDLAELRAWEARLDRAYANLWDAVMALESGR